MMPVNMLTTGQSFPISQREFESGSCVDLRVGGRLGGFRWYMLRCTIGSILAVTLYQSRPIVFSDRVLSRLGNTLWRDRHYLFRFAWTE